MRAAAPVLVAALSLAACAQVDSPIPEQVLPNDYRTAFEMASDCRSSSDHDFRHVMVRVRPEQRALYQQASSAFPLGSLVVKEEFDTDDVNCQSLVGYTVMRKEKTSVPPLVTDWQWYRLDGYGNVSTKGEGRCLHCHQMCGATRDFTCLDPTAR
jgi:hypothetical protein